MKKNKKQKSSKKALLIMSVVIVVLILFIGGIFCWQKNNVKEEKTNNIKINRDAFEKLNDKLLNKNTEEKTSLKTYTNSQYGFSFQYPEDYLVEENYNEDTKQSSIKVLSKKTKDLEQSEISKCKQSPGISSCGIFDALYVDGMLITWLDNTKTISLNDWISVNVPNIYSQKKLMINNAPAIEVVQMGLDGKSVFVYLDSKIYQFHKFSNTDPVFDQIINSFKLTK